jgi:hypothetical protein
MQPRIQTKKYSRLLFLLLIPLLLALFPPFYNFTQPELIGVPFFYWFQLFLIVITAIIIAMLYRARE